MNFRKNTCTGPYGLRKTREPSKRMRDYLVVGVSSCSNEGPESQTREFSTQRTASPTAVTPGEKGRRRKQAKPRRVSTDLRPLPSTAPASTPHPSSITGQLSRDEPLVIHGHSVQDYQKIFHSVVDPMLRRPSGKPQPYSLELGRRIKQRLWEELYCPALQEDLQPDGRVHITETFCTPTLRSFVPYIDVDISGEPMPGQPMKKKPKH